MFGSLKQGVNFCQLEVVVFAKNEKMSFQFSSQNVEDSMKRVQKKISNLKYFFHG